MVTLEIIQCEAYKVVNESMAFTEMFSFRNKHWRKVPDLKIFGQILACYAFISNFDGIKKWKRSNKALVIHAFTRTQWNPILYTPASSSSHRITGNRNETLEIAFEASLEFFVVMRSDLKNPPPIRSMEDLYVRTTDFRRP
jgi:hypothetical protein